MNKFIKTNIFILIIVFFAFFFRVVNVNINPPSLSWDEVSIGYNAFSILKTARDEHGIFLPLDTFAAYGDYKPPLSVYLTVPFVWIFGLNETAVRLPSVLAGTVTVFLAYLLVMELFYSHKKKKQLAYLTAGLLAISPWHIILSRAGFEANIALVFLVWGIILALKTRFDSKLFIYLWIPYVLAVYTFNSSRYVAPLIGLGLVYVLRKKISIAPITFIKGVIIAVVFLLPIIPHILSPQARLRFKEVNIFSELSIIENANLNMKIDQNSLFSKIIHNRRFGYARSYLSHFFDHFQPNFLFVKGDGNPKFSIQDTGQLYIIEAPLLIFGVLFLLTKRKKIGLFLLFWLFTSIIPAATARETPHALRIENSLPVWQIFIAFGLVGINRMIKNKKIKYLMYVIVCSVYLFEFSFFYHTYMNHFPKKYSREWQYGYKNAIEFINGVSKDYKSVVISDSIGRPYMYTLFYTQYDPDKFRNSKDAYFDAAGFYNVRGFDKYRFVRGAPSEFDSDSIYVLPPDHIPDNSRILTDVKLLNGEIVYKIFDIR
ncbi:ArnT family glycosyltransferase [Patescibacteria group bacterium]